MLNNEVVVAAALLNPQLEIERRIAEGLIPPAPSFVNDHAAWSQWYKQHIRCCTPAHAYFLRARGSIYCDQCIADGTAATREMTKAVESYMAIGVTNPALDADLRKSMRAWTIDTIGGELAKLPPEVRERAQDIWRKTFPEAAALVKAAEAHRIAVRAQPQSPIKRTPRAMP